MYRSAKTGKIYYFGTSKSGEVEQWELFESNGKVDAKKARNFKLGSVVEGCVADDELGHFYAAEEPPESGNLPSLRQGFNTHRSPRSATATSSPTFADWPSLMARTARAI